MDAIVEAVLVKQCTTFNIGHKVALFLQNFFINQDGTLTSFIRALKVACLLHFSMEPLSVIHGRLAEDQMGKSALSPETMLKYMDELPTDGSNNNGEEDLSNDDGSQAEGKKRRLNMEQVKTLEKIFELGNKLEPERKMQLARGLGL
ncbi:unnamed protein product [Lupinus luteus]|uniref:Origin recognition complex subunit 3 N-terminal domain-containing protein n=1 Tax=Lupinus luteus TaxID=3873 RepID=A0AAV1W263_LUPLU